MHLRWVVHFCLFLQMAQEVQSTVAEDFSLETEIYNEVCSTYLSHFIWDYCHFDVLTLPHVGNYVNKSIHD